MRILQIIDSLHWGGVQQLQLTLAAAAQKTDISLSMVSLRAEENTPYPARLQKLGVPVRYLPAQKLLDRKRIITLYRWMRSEGYDLIHTHLPYSDIVGAFAAGLARIPVIATLHVPNVETNRLRKRLHEWVLIHLMQQVLAVGVSVAETFPTVAKARHVHIVHNAIILPPERPQEERLKTRRAIMGNDKGPVLISVGRLDEAKGFEDLLQGISWLIKKHPTLCLWIAGAGSYLPVLESQIRSRGLSENVRLLGGRADVDRLLAASDIYVSTSRMEGMSISILEAMAAGLPVVATCVGENSRLILPTTGILVPIGDIQALTDAIDRLIESPVLRESLGAEARSLVHRSHNVDAWFAQIRSLYLDVLRPTT